MAKKVAKLNPKEDQITKEILRQFCPKIKKSKIIDNTGILASTSQTEYVFVNETESVGEPPVIDSEDLGSNPGRDNQTILLLTKNHTFPPITSHNISADNSILTLKFDENETEKKIITCQSYGTYSYINKFSNKYTNLHFYYYRKCDCNSFLYNID